MPEYELLVNFDYYKPESSGAYPLYNLKITYTYKMGDYCIIDREIKKDSNVISQLSPYLEDIQRRCEKFIFQLQDAEDESKEFFSMIDDIYDLYNEALKVDVNKLNRDKNTIEFKSTIIRCFAILENNKINIMDRQPMDKELTLLYNK